MSLSAIYEMDTVKENEGVVIELGEHNGKPIEIRIARRGGSNKEYKKAVERNTKPVRRLIETGQLSDAQDKKINATIFAESVAKGWSNVPLSDVTGNKADENTLAEFTVENVVALMVRLPEVAAHLYSQSSSADLFALQREDDAKN